MNNMIDNVRWPLVHECTDYINSQFEYCTTHDDAVDEYTTMLNSSELSHRCLEVYFSNNGMRGVAGAREHVAIIDMAYLGQTEIEFVLDYVVGDTCLSVDEIAAIEERTDAIIRQREYGVFAYMQHTDCSVMAIIDIAHDCKIGGIASYDTMYDIKTGIDHCGWTVEYNGSVTV